MRRRITKFLLLVAIRKALECRIQIVVRSTIEIPFKIQFPQIFYWKKSSTKSSKYPISTIQYSAEHLRKGLFQFIPIWTLFIQRSSILTFFPRLYSIINSIFHHYFKLYWLEAQSFFKYNFFYYFLWMPSGLIVMEATITSDVYLLKNAFESR